MAYAVRVTEEAERDLLELFCYVAQHDSIRAAEHVLDKLEQACQRLQDFPARGHVPPELERLAIPDYREIHWKPYRILYEVAGRQVNILAVLDGRRDLQDLLMRRLLR